MQKTLEFPDLLRLIDQRSTAFRAAVSSAPSLDEQVPTCPEWTLFDLAQHLGEGRRRWAATVAAGPAAVDYHATEGRSWRLWLSADGARTARLPQPGTMPAAVAGEDPDAADASARGTASELVLTLCGRVAVDSLKLDGDRRLFDQLIAWDPEE